MAKIRDEAKGVFSGFKTFVLRGNVVDLAVGVVIGASFNSVISALVSDLISPLIAAIFKQPNYSNLAFTIHGSKFQYGSFLNAFISFLIEALVVYFFVVLPINSLTTRMKGPPPPPATKKCPECLSNIPKDATRCAFCTVVLTS